MKLEKINIEDLQIFYETAKSQSLSVAAKNLVLDISKIRHSILKIEKCLGKSLFLVHGKRAESKFYLTQEGEKFFEYAKTILEQHAVFLKDLANQTERISISCTQVFFTHVIQEMLNTHHEKYHDLSVIFDEQNYPPGGIRSSLFDIHIMNVQQIKGRYYHKKIMEYDFNFYASKEYVEQYGAPKGWNDLEHHRLISWNGESLYCLNKIEHVKRLFENKHTKCTSNSDQALLEFILKGLCCGYTADYIVRDKALIQLDGFESIPFYKTLYCNQEKMNKPIIAEFVHDLEAFVGSRS